MRVSNKRRGIIGLSIITILYVTAISYVLAASLIQTPNILSGEPAINRAVACSQTTVYCYAMGGGADLGTDTPVVNRYNRDTDTVSSVQMLPDPVIFFQYTAGGYSNFIVGHGAPNLSANTITYIYNETTDTWQTVDPAFSTGGAHVGVVVENYHYIIDIGSGGSGVISAYRLDLDDIASGYSLHGIGTGWGAFSLSGAKSVYDPVEQKVLIFPRNDGELISFNVVTAQFDSISDRFAPCDAAGACQPSLAFFDNNLGILAGKQGTPSATAIGLYQFDWTTETFSASTVETLSNANFNSQQFTASAVFQPAAGWAVNSTGETETFFGSSRTNSSAPGYSANMYWLRTGDPGGINPTTADIDSWLTNFLTGIGMNGAFGRVLVGSLFAMFVFLILTVKGVPWIISLGIGGLGITFLTAATLLSESILLGMVAIILIGGMGLIMALMSGGNRDG